MFVAGLRKICHRQRGFTLVEILVALAITGLVAAGIAASISQIIDVNARTSTRMTAIKQIEVVIDRIRIDMQMAQEISNSDPNDSTVKLILKWKEWDNTINLVTYRLDDNNQLSRMPSYGTFNAVAKNIQQLQAAQLADGNWSITITATVGGYKPATESRTFEVKPRSGK
jgi:prepilin-type N-terminal cleavage/methylation domain-containing protein